MIDWRIYYGDGSTFDSSMGGPWDAPGHGVVAIVKLEPDLPEQGRSVLHRWDWYYYRDGDGWWGSDIHGMLDQFTHDRDNKLSSLKAGWMVTNERYRELVDKARYDRDFPNKLNKTLKDQPIVNK